MVPTAVVLRVFQEVKIAPGIFLFLKWVVTVVCNMNPQCLSDNAFIDIYFKHCGTFIGAEDECLFQSEKV